MRAGDLTDLPNPFAMPTRTSRRGRRRPLVTALKFFLLVAIGFCVTLVVGTQSRQWLVHRLTADFATLSRNEKIRRLDELAALGEAGIPAVVRALADENTDVARAAYELLQSGQNEWTTLPGEKKYRRHRLMIEALAEVAPQVPDDRSGWPSALLQQTMMQTVGRGDEVSRQLYAQSNRVLDRYALSNRPGPSVLQAGSFDPQAPQRLKVRAEPLPVAVAEVAGNWTDWPPTSSARPAGEATMDPPRAKEAATTSPEPTPVIATEPPTVYRSSLSPLRPLEPGDSVQLDSVIESRETAYQAEDIRPVTNLVDSPLQTYDDKSIFHWLGSPHQVLREQARLELIRRGYDGGQIALAARIANGDEATRLELVDAIARSDTLDPRPWLTLLLDDESRRVQLRTISVLATMNDPAVNAELRTRLVDQADPIVAARLRRVLDLR